MAISVQCVKCDRTLKVNPDFTSRTIRCPGCQSPLKVSAAEDELGDLEFADQKFEDDIQTAATIVFDDPSI